MTQNIFQNIPSELPDELFQELESGKSFRLERIVSRGHESEPGSWYDQTSSEWVILLAGSARIEFDSEEDDIDMSPGDYLLIPAKRRHRVATTSSMENTIWLAIHFET